MASSTRSKIQKTQQLQFEDETATEPDRLTVTGPASQSTVRYVTESAPMPFIPITSGPPLDHKAERRTTPPPTAPIDTRSRATSARSSRVIREAVRRRKIYEASQKLSEIEKEVINKKLAMELAEIDVQSEEEIDEIDNRPAPLPERTARHSFDKVVDWMMATPGAHAATEPVENVQRQRAAPESTRERGYSPPPPSPRTPRGESAGRGIAELTEVLSKLARPRPVPKQTYELPIFHGNIMEWRLFKNAYELTTEMYTFSSFENLARLRVAVQGKARLSVAHLLAANSKPETIMVALERKFGRPELIVENVLQQTKALPHLNDRNSDISDFAVTVRNCVAVLQDVDNEGHVHNPFFVKELCDKLTPLLYNKYTEHVTKERSNGSKEAKLAMLADFLDREAELVAIGGRAAAALQPNVSAPPRTTADRAPRKHDTAQRVNVQVEMHDRCTKCDMNHKLPACDEFKKMNHEEKWNFVKSRRLCFKCLIKAHPRMYCRARGCAKCQRAHHTILHQVSDARRPPNEPRATSPVRPTSADATITTHTATHGATDAERVAARATIATRDAHNPERYECVTNIGTKDAQVLLKVVPVTIINEGKRIETHALLDDGATVTLLDRSVASEIAATGPRQPLRIVTARGIQVNDQQSERVSVTVVGPNGAEHEVFCRTIADLDLPQQTLSAWEINRLGHLRQCRINELDEAKPLLLIGQDNWELITSHDIRRGKSGELVASLSDLGWAAHGRRGHCHTDSDSETVLYINNIETLFKEYFSLESLGVVERERSHKEDRRALEILDKTSRQIEKQWEVGLLWKEDDSQLPDNYFGAKKRLLSVENKMDKDSDFAIAYANQIDRLIDNGYARRVDKILNKNCFYLPHFAVTNPNKPGKVRVVFDAAARFEGKSLNDYLLVGPDLLNNLMGILFRFRIGAIAFTADIQDMFLRIKICESDQRAQLFLWRGANRDREPDAYAMTSVIFGAASSPTTAICILNKNNECHAEEFPEAAMVTKQSHYMDDLLQSVSEIETARKIVDDVTTVHARGNFHIRGWASNSAIKINRRVLWTDSKTVLKWINSNPRNYKPYVSHRLAEIYEQTNPSEWRWVNSIDNSADDASRETTKSLDRWLAGPSFLSEAEDAWPVDKHTNNHTSDSSTDTEIKGVGTVLMITQPRDVIDVTRFSSWTRLIRATAYVTLFINKCKKRQRGPLSATNILDAERLVVKLSQEKSFSTEIALIREGKPIPKSSRLNKLDPILLDDVLRVRGRINKFDTFSTEEKHPVILDGRDYTARLLVMHYHKRAGHANHETVVAMISEKYYITKIRNTVRRVARECRFCKIRRALPTTPKMGDLPTARLAYRQRPFTHCGLDYFGPMEVTIGRRREKRWAALFTCMTTRAVHIELATSLSADSAILALRRFIARRGQPTAIYSDHGTNFMGADAELQRARLEDAAVTRAIEWRMIPPSAPHMGGCWERLVRSIKTALRATLNSRAPKEEVLYTLLLEAEAIVNSRPLTHVSTEADDPVPLTPNHFLLGTASGERISGSFLDPDCRKQWRVTQALADTFWQRWLGEYVPTLQKRQKWTMESPPVKVGDVVFIADPALPRNTWPRGLVERLHPGADGRVRVVDVRTARGVLRRPTTRLVILPTE